MGNPPASRTVHWITAKGFNFNSRLSREGTTTTYIGLFILLRKGFAVEKEHRLTLPNRCSMDRYFLKTVTVKQCSQSMRSGGDIFVPDRGAQCHHCPTRCHGGNPLIVIVWKPTLKVWLKLWCPAGDVPRSVGKLCFQQPL